MAVVPEIKYKSPVKDGICEGCTFSDGIFKEFQWEGEYLQRGELTMMVMNCNVNADQPTQIEGVATFQSASGETADQTTRQEIPQQTCHIKRQLFPDSQESQVHFD